MATLGDGALSSKESVKVGDETVEGVDEEGVAREPAPHSLLRDAILKGVSERVRKQGRKRGRKWGVGMARPYLSLNASVA